MDSGIHLQPRNTGLEEYVLDMLRCASSSGDGRGVLEATAGSRRYGGAGIECGEGDLEDDDGDTMLVGESIESVSGTQDLLSRPIADAEADSL